MNLFKNKHAIGQAIFFLLFLVNISTYAQKTRIVGTDGNNIKYSRLTSEIEKIRQKEVIPGISIAIINDNTIVYHEVFGVENVQSREAISKQSIFEAASLSKPIFAYFVMKMAEQGKIDLDKPLHEYLPHPGITADFQEDSRLITARMVLAHQTGLPNHSYGKPMKLAFKPGTDFMYSGEGYQYLAAVIGLQHGFDWKTEINSLFQNEVTEPLNMPHSSFVWNDYLAKNKVYGHDKDRTPSLNQPDQEYWDGSFQAYATLHSEAGEYSQFILAMLKQEGLASESFLEMLKEQTHFKDDNPLKQQVGQTGWGLGFTQKVTEEYTMHMHTGNNHDFQAYTMFIPQKKYGLVVFTNSDKMIPFLMGLSQIIGPQF